MGVAVQEHRMALDKNSKSNAGTSELDNFGVWVKNPPDTVSGAAAASGKPPAGDVFFDDLTSFDDMFETIETEHIAGHTPADGAMGFAAVGDESVFDGESGKTARASSEKTAKTSGETAAGDTAAILKRISSELSSLRSEINAIKADLESLKSRDRAFSTAAPQKDDFEEKISSKPGDVSESGEGFFSAAGDDETIALSGDELQNILTNSEFPEFQEQGDAIEGAEDMPDTGFDGDALGEPEIEASSFDEDEPGTDELPEEPVITEEAGLPEPKPDDDIFVASSDFNDDGIEGAEFEPEEADCGTIFDDPVTVSDEEEAFLSKLPGGASGIIDENSVFEEQSVFTEESGSTEQSAVEEDIDDTPTEKVFGEQWGDAAAEAIEETSPAQFAPGVSGSPSLDKNLMEQVKTVLIYMDRLLENLPEEKIEEIANSEDFETYHKLFKELGIS
jgi:hypothetical protein